MNRFLAIVTGLVWLVLALQSDVHAQPKPGYAPSSTHVFPAGARRGSRVMLRVGSECLPPGAQFRVLGVGVSADTELGAELSAHGERSLARKPTETPITYPREWSAEMQIDADAPTGIVFWRLHCAQGGTGNRPFVISDLPEFVESESNSTMDRADQITLPQAVNGQIHGERDVDWYRFAAQPGQVVSCEVLAGRLGSPLDPVIDIYDENGRRQNVDRAYIGSDPVLVLRASSAADYLIRVAHVNHRGDSNFVYRLHLVPRPFVRCAYPHGGRRGHKTLVNFLLLDGSGRYQLLPKTIDVPDALGAFVYDTSSFGANSVKLSSRPEPVSLESEPNHGPQSATRLEVPGCVFGQYKAPLDRDVYRIDVAETAPLVIHCAAASPGTPALPVISLRDSMGKLVAQATSVAADRAECRLHWTAAPGAYFVTTHDVRSGSRGGHDFVYRLSVNHAEPDFEVDVDQDAVNLQPGHETVLEVKLKRLAGFDKAVELHVDGLPEDIQVSGGQIAAGKQSTQLKFKPDVGSASRAFNIALHATSDVDNQTHKRVVRCRHLGVDMEGVSYGDPYRNQLSVSVLHKPLFRLFCQEAYLYAHRGSVFPYPMQVERLNGFDGEIHLQIGDRQNRDLDGIQMRTITIPPGQSAVKLPIYLPESMAINVQSQSQLYAQAWARFTDEDQRSQSVLVLSEKRNMLRTLPPVFKLTADQEQVVVSQDGQAECRLRLKRTTNAPGPVTISLHRGPESVRCEPAQFKLKEGQTEARVTLRVADGFAYADRQPLVFRAVGFLPDGIEVVTEARVQIEPAADATTGAAQP